MDEQHWRKRALERQLIHLKRTREFKDRLHPDHRAILEQIEQINQKLRALQT